MVIDEMKWLRRRRHRLRRDPLDESGSTARVGRAVDEVLGQAADAA